MESICQIIEVCMVGYATVEQLECLRNHMDQLIKLRQTSLSDDDLDEAEALGLLWKTQFIALFTGVYEKVAKLGTNNYSRSHFSLINSLLGYVPLSLNFVNLETMEHWADQIRYLGAPWVQSTKLYEHCHHKCKKAARTTNGHNLERDVTLQVRPTSY